MYYKQILREKPIYEDILDYLGKEYRESLYNSVFMPVLIEYVSWVLEEAQKSGKKRLYFLARDGYQMYLAAQKLCEMQKLSLECRYLEVSRFAMRLPEYHLLKERCVDYICTGGIDVTTERILKRSGLQEELAGTYLNNYSAKRLLNYKEVQDIKGNLRSNTAFLEQVYEVSKKAYEPAICYLRQEGLMDGVSMAFVDSGWVGTLQQSISHLLGRKDLEGYYFGLYEIPKHADSKKYHAFYFSPASGLRRKVNFSNCLFEAVFTSPEGMTIGYECKESRYVPIKDFHTNPNEIQVSKNIRDLDAYMDVYKTLMHNHKISHEDMYTSKKKRTAFVEKLFCKCMGEPTNWEVSILGNLLFSDDVLEGNLKKVAADLTTEEIRTQRFLNKALIMLGRKDEELHESAWIEGSIQKNGVQMKQNLYHAKLYKVFVYIRKYIHQM